MGIGGASVRQNSTGTAARHKVIAATLNGCQSVSCKSEPKRGQRMSQPLAYIHRKGSQQKNRQRCKFWCDSVVCPFVLVHRQFAVP